MGQSLAPIAYYPPGHYHFPEGSLPIYGCGDRFRGAIAVKPP
ncbi:hypothetical protein [Limnospira fusiformis]